MPLSLSQVAGNKATHTFEYAGGSLTITYLPSLITDQTVAMLLGFGRLTTDTVVEQFHELNDLLHSILVDWDLYENDAQTQKISRSFERIAKLPIEFKMTLLNEMLGASRAGEVKGASSPPSVDTSSTVIDSGSTPSAVLSPNGTNS